jgi:GntR family transcriptional regulator, carbon starvation induced regulator
MARRTGACRIGANHHREEDLAQKTLEQTFTETASDLLVNDIVAGVFVPDEKLRIEHLKERYSIGASPLREALARLIALGFVTNESRRGFRVAPMSLEDVRDITLSRRMVETTALRRSIEFGDSHWESSIVECLARLTWAGDQYRLGKSEYAPVDAAHYAFNRSLISACRSPRLLMLHDMLYNQASRYRHIMMKALLPGLRFQKSHKVLADLTLRREADDACAALSLHLEKLEKEACAALASHLDKLKKSAHPNREETNRDDAHFRRPGKTKLSQLA